MFELAAANMSHRSIQRILHGVPMDKYLRAPSKSEYATSLLQMRVRPQRRAHDQCHTPDHLGEVVPTTHIIQGVR